LFVVERTDREEPIGLIEGEVDQYHRGNQRSLVLRRTSDSGVISTDSEPSHHFDKDIEIPVGEWMVVVSIE